MTDFTKFDNFLKDWDLYKENKELWKEMICRTTKSENEEWLITRFANGEDFFDGNPLYSALIKKKNKGIRIIQLENIVENPIFASWTSTVELEDSVIEELTIALILNEYTYRDAEKLIQQFLNNYKSFKKYLDQLEDTYTPINNARQNETEKISAYKIRTEALAIQNLAYRTKIEALELLNSNLLFLKDSESKNQTSMQQSKPVSIKLTASKKHSSIKKRIKLA